MDNNMKNKKIPRCCRNSSKIQ